VVGPDGRRIVSHALLKVRQAYGVDLPYCRDANRDGFPTSWGSRRRPLARSIIENAGPQAGTLR
jgi:hypothetical protein